MSDLATILVVDDDPGTCQTIGDVLRLRGYSTKIANRGGSALETLSGRGVDLAILDVQLPDVSGLELLQSLKKSSPSTEVIIITGHPSVPTAVQAIDGTTGNSKAQLTTVPVFTNAAAASTLFSVMRFSAPR